MQTKVTKAIRCTDLVMIGSLLATISSYQSATKSSFLAFISSAQNMDQKKNSNFFSSFDRVRTDNHCQCSSDKDAPINIEIFELKKP